MSGRGGGAEQEAGRPAPGSPQRPDGERGGEAEDSEHRGSDGKSVGRLHPQQLALFGAVVPAPVRGLEVRLGGGVAWLASLLVRASSAPEEGVKPRGQAGGRL